MIDPNHKKPPRSPTSEDKAQKNRQALDGSPTSVTNLFNNYFSESKDENDPVEVDYEVNPSILYRYIETKDWKNVIDRCNKCPSEAGTIVYRKDASTDKFRWRQSPLHAALVFQGKTAVIATLVKAFPQAVFIQDDQGMLPIHLAFRYRASEAVINLLLGIYPESVNSKDNKGRIPIVLVRAHEKRSKHSSSQQPVTLRTYVETYHAMAMKDFANEQKQAYNQKYRTLMESHRSEIKEIKNRFDYLEQCDIKCELLLKDAIQKIKVQEADLAAKQKENQKNKEKMEEMETDMKKLKNELNREKNAKKEFMNREKLRAREEKKEDTRFDNQEKEYQNKLAVLEGKVQILSISNEAIKSEKREKEDSLREITHASEILLQKVHKLEKSLATERSRYIALQGKMDSKGDTEAQLMTRVCELTENLLNRSAEKKALIKKHTEDMKRVMEENADLQRKCMV